MREESSFDPPVDPPVGPLANDSGAESTAAAQLAAEAALGRALLMVQRMEEDARQRAELASVQRIADAEREAQQLIDHARQRAATIAELTRDSVARVLAEEHAALLQGLGELVDLERRLRHTVASSRERIASVLEQSDGATAAPGVAAPDPGVAPAPPGMPAAPAVPAPIGELDLDAPVAGADDAFFADLRTAVDGDVAIAGRGSQPPSGTPSGVATGSQAGALSAAAAAATAAVAEPMVLGEPRVAPPDLRVVPPPLSVPSPAAPPPPTVAVPTIPVPVTEMPEPGLSGDTLEPGPSGTDAVAAPGSRRERATRRRSRWAMVGTGLRNLGILLLLFVAFQLWGTAALEHRDQAKLRHAFQLAVATQAAPTTRLTSGNPSDPSTVTTATTIAAPPAAPSGAAVAVIKIPKIGVEQAVVEGTGVGDLRKGPGHYRNTPLPGQPGNAAIAGHRTTYGAPFNRIDELSVGDPILVTTLQGTFKYIVSEAPFPVSPSQNNVLFNKNDNRLTLTTCHPKYSAAKRLIVVAKLAPRVKPAAASKVTKPVTAATAGDAGTGGDAGALLPALFWGAMVGLAYAAMVCLSRRWIPRAAFFLGVPVVLALLFPFFEQLSRLLPANY